jgi:hypothetical protein
MVSLKKLVASLFSKKKKNPPNPPKNTVAYFAATE